MIFASFFLCAILANTFNLLSVEALKRKSPEADSKDPFSEKEFLIDDVPTEYTREDFDYEGTRPGIARNKEVAKSRSPFVYNFKLRPTKKELEKKKRAFKKYKEIAAKDIIADEKNALDSLHSAEELEKEYKMFKKENSLNQKEIDSKEGRETAEYTEYAAQDMLKKDKERAKEMREKEKKINKKSQKERKETRKAERKTKEAERKIKKAERKIEATREDEEIETDDE